MLVLLGLVWLFWLVIRYWMISVGLVMLRIRWCIMCLCIWLLFSVYGLVVLLR